MKSFIFMTKTRWAEAPRIRHQLARLLAQRGHKVFFFERPDYPFHEAVEPVESEPNIVLIRSRQLLHHQLRVLESLQSANAMYECGKMRSAIRDADIDRVEDAVVLNFAYEYYFLREIFPSQKILTVINDDFVAQAHFRRGIHVRKALVRTVEMSTKVLCVSYPLIRQVGSAEKSVLFLPWSDGPYRTPARAKTRKSVLFWGVLDARVDYKLVEYLLERRADINFIFVGPVKNGFQRIVSDISSKYQNFRYVQPTSLDLLNVDDCFAAIIPYKAGVGDIEAVTASNKTFRLLSLGLPIIAHGMPEFFEHEVVFKADSYSLFLDSIDICVENFFSLQESIERLVNQNDAESRYQQLMSYA